MSESEDHDSLALQVFENEGGRCWAPPEEPSISTTPSGQAGNPEPQQDGPTSGIGQLQRDGADHGRAGDHHRRARADVDDAEVADLGARPEAPMQKLNNQVSHRQPAQCIEAAGLHGALQTRYVGAATRKTESTRGRKLGRAVVRRPTVIVDSCPPDRWSSSRPTGMLAALRLRPAVLAGLFFTHRFARHAELHLSGGTRALKRLLALLRGRSGGLPSFLPRVACRNSQSSINQEMQIENLSTQTTKECV